MARIIRPLQTTVNRVGRHYKPFQTNRPEKIQQFQPSGSQKSANFPETIAESVKSG
jgi:hypothetical protein